MEDRANFPKIIAVAFITWLIAYISIAFIAWDIAWISDMDTWSSLVRFIFWCLVLICVIFGAIVEVCQRDD